MITAVFPNTQISAVIEGVVAPATGATPVKVTNQGIGYTGKVTWKANKLPFNGTTFAEQTGLRYI